MRRRGVLGALALPALAWSAPSQGAPQAITVVASFSILHDMVASVCGPRATVRSLVGPNSDAHNYQGRPSDVQAIAAAALLVSNGLGFEPWLPRLIDAVGFKARPVVASAGIEPLMRSGVPDPHCWQDVANARRYVANIAEGRLARGLALSMPDWRRLVNARRERVTFLDLTFSADKSLSVAWALAPTPAERALLLDIHRTAVTETMRYVEQTLGQVRRGDGGRHGKEPGQIAWITFNHFTSRPTVDIERVDKEGRSYTDFATVPLRNGAVPRSGRRPSLH